MLQAQPVPTTMVGERQRPDDTHLGWYVPVMRLRDGRGRFFCLFVTGVLITFLTLISATAVYHSKGDEAIVAFVATSYLELVLLVCCLWLYRNTEPGGAPLRNRLKASVWALTTLLTFSFGYIVMGIAGLTLPVALLVWVIAAATGIGAFSAFFEQGRSTALEGIQRLRDGGRFSCGTVAVLFGVLTLISVMAVYHSKDDKAIMAFVASSYANLVLLARCLWLYKSSAQGSPQRNRLKASVWTLTTLLTFSFGYMVMGMASLTLSIALLVWIIAAATGIGAFSAFFELARINALPDATMEV